MGESFGALLRRLREDANKTMKDLARFLDVTTPYISNVELDRKPPMSQARIIAVAEYLGADPTELLVAAADTRQGLMLETDGLSEQDLKLAAGLARRWGDMTESERRELQRVLEKQEKRRGSSGST